MDKRIKTIIDNNLSQLDNSPDHVQLTDEEVKELILKFPPTNCIGRCVPFIFSMPKQQYIFLGSKFETITGYHPSDIMRLTASEFMTKLIPANHLKLLMLADAEAFRVVRAQYNGRYDVQINSDMTMIRKDGSSIRIMLQSRPLIWDEEGNIKIAGGFIVDISHIKLHGLPSTTLVSEGDIIYSYQPTHKELVEHKITDFSLRELELISMMAIGDDVDDLIRKTGLSKATVYAHRRNILAKSELATMQKVIESLRKEGLID